MNRMINHSLLALLAAGLLMPIAQGQDEQPKPEPNPIKITVIGFAVDQATQTQLQNMAKAGNGQFLSADDENGLLNALGTATGVDVGVRNSKEVEPNNDKGTSTAIYHRGNITAQIKPERDVDVYVMEVDQGGLLDVKITNVPPELALKVAVHSADGYSQGNTLAPLREGAETTGQFGIRSPGRYFLTVYDANKRASDQNYTLNLDFHACDGHEPNDKNMVAKAISHTGEVFGNILPIKDLDIYEVEVDQCGMLEVAVTDVAPELDLLVHVYDMEGYSMGSLAPLRAGAETRGFIKLPEPGVYRIHVYDSGSNGFSSQLYKLATKFHAGDDMERNDKRKTATLTELQADLDPTINPAGDVDIFTFRVPRRGSVKIDVTNVPGNLAIKTLLYDGNGYSHGSATPLAEGGETKAVYDLPDEGRYFLHVHATDKTKWNAQPYHLQIAYQPGDANESNENKTSATKISVGSTVNGTLNPKGDVDLYRIVLNDTGEYEVNIPGVKELDIVCYVTDEAGYSKGTLKPLAVGGDTIGKFTASKPGRYYVHVYDNGKDARSTNPYQMTIRLTRKVEKSN